MRLILNFMIIESGYIRYSMALWGMSVLLDMKYNRQWLLCINYFHLDKVLVYYQITFLNINYLVRAYE